MLSSKQKKIARILKIAGSMSWNMNWDMLSCIPVIKEVWQGCNEITEALEIAELARYQNNLCQGWIDKMLQKQIWRTFIQKVFS